MSDDSPGLAPGDVGRSWRTAVLACCCLLALLLAAGALPALSAPLDSDDSPGSSGPVSSAVGDAVEEELDQQIVGGSVSDETRLGGLDRYNQPGDAELFTVDADRPDYWRSTSYDTYDHDGWLRSDETVDPLDIPYRSDRETFEHEVTFTRPLGAVPAAPMPIEAGGSVDVGMDSGGGLQAEEPIRTGDSMTVRSARPITDRNELAEHDDWDQPDDVEEHFTDLPDDVPDRVHDRTAEITADADNPHEKAVAIEQWLRENRDYSLQVPPPEGDVADELLFEREAAHCAYFATTMAVMLRSENVPARYVTGYTSGEATDEGFTVRERNAHAWVEVYYPGIGWVPFEPTPPSDRQDALDEASPDTVEPHGFDPADANETTDPDDPGDNETITEEGLSIEPESSAVPGQPLTVTVTYNGEPLPWNEVAFDGEVVGVTDDDGQVTGEVPYTEDLEIEVLGYSAPSDDEFASGTSAGAVAGSGGVQEDDDSVTVPVDSDVDVAFEGPPLAGESATIVATIDENPVPDADVSIDGEVVATTDENGTAVVTLPADESVTLRVERDEVAGERTLEPTEIDLDVENEPLAGESLGLVATADEHAVSDADVSIDGEVVATTDDDGSATVDVPPREAFTLRVERSAAAGERTVEPIELDVVVEDEPYVLPYRSTDVVAEANGTPIEGVPVVVDGEIVATTDENGTASVTLPPAVSATIALGSNGQLAETTVHPLPVLAGVLVVLGAGVGVAVLLARRIGRDGARSAAQLPGAVAASLVNALVAASEGIDRLIDSVDGSFRRLVAVVGSGLVAAPAVLAGQARRLVVGLAALALALLRAPIAVLRGGGGSARADGSTTARPAADGPSDVPTDDSDPMGVVRRTWYAMVAALPIARPETRTPAELAEAATDAGFPERAVRRVLDAFRTVEYGARDPSPEEVEHVRTAFEDGPDGGEDG